MAMTEISTTHHPVSAPSALVLGVSSGIGAGIALALARSGYRIIGVHLDLADRDPEIQALRDRLCACGMAADFFNANAASDMTIADIVGRIPTLCPTGRISVLVHSLAFGALLPFIEPRYEAPAPQLTRKQMDMTLHVMAHSLVYWLQALIASDGIVPGGKVFALTSAGSSRVTAGYGAVSAAKCALESHVRQLALELAPYRIAVNAVRAGVTDTPALRKIPGAQGLIDRVTAANPYHRLTTPEDVGAAVVSLCLNESPWMTGNVIGVDGAEQHCS